MIKPVDLRMSLKKKSSLPAPPLAFLQVSSELHKQTGESVPGAAETQQDTEGMCHQGPK